MKNSDEKELFLRAEFPKDTPAGDRDLGEPLAEGRGSSTRILIVALAGRAHGRWASFQEAFEADPGLRTLAGHGGSCLALAAYAAAARNDGLEEPALAISVGEAVRRGLPTAARATITARAPLRAGVVEAPFGGSFAQALARTTDVLLILGSAPGERSVLGIDVSGEVQLRTAERAASASTTERARGWAGIGTHALLVGPAAEVGLPFANLGSWDGGDDGAAPSLVGRGGLGATMAQAGLLAITVEDPVVPPVATGDPGLSRALESSPRLIARAKGGTLELDAVRGDTSPRAASADPGGRRIKHGCTGCPTPCGWQFELPQKPSKSSDARPRSRVGGRFAALQGFLRTGSTEEAMSALETCNALGVDARTAALVLAATHAAAWGEGLDALMDPQSSVYRYARSLSPEDDREPANPLMPSDLAGRVGVALAARGPEPLRSLSVLGLQAVDTSDSSVREAWGHQLGLSGLTEDVDYNAGVIAYWQECYSAAVDHSGFCAFSASALIADGVMTLDELAQRITGVPNGGAGWLALGAMICSFHLELHAAGSSTFSGAEKGLPEATLRGYRNASSRETRPEVPARESSQHAAPPAHGQVGAAGTVQFLVTGMLASKLKRYAGAEEGTDATTGRPCLRLPVPLAHRGEEVRALVKRVAIALPEARAWLQKGDGAPLPAILIAGQSVGPRTPLHGGEEVELLLVIPGG